LVFRFGGLEEDSGRISCTLDCAPTFNLMVGREEEAADGTLGCLGATIEGLVVKGAGFGKALGAEEIRRGTALTGSATGGWACSAASKVLLMIVHSTSFLNQPLRK
jgi:hypothetical protein